MTGCKDPNHSRRDSKDYADIAEVFFAPADIIWDPHACLQPELFVPASEVTGEWRGCQDLLLAVEVGSPNSARADRVTKRRLYPEAARRHLLDRGSRRADRRGLAPR